MAAVHLDIADALESVSKGLRGGGEKELHVGMGRLRRCNPVEVHNPWAVFYELLEHLSGSRAVGLDLTSKEMLSDLIRRFLMAHWLKNDTLVVDAVHKKNALQLCRRLLATAEANADVAPTGTIVFNIAASQLVLEQLQSATPVPVGSLCAKVAKAVLSLSVSSLLGAVADTALELVDIGALLASKERIDTLVAAAALGLVADHGQAVIALGTMLREHREGKWLEMWAIADALSTITLKCASVTQLSLLGSATGSKHTLTLFNLATFDDWWFEPAWRVRERAVRAIITIHYTARQRGDATVEGASHELLALCVTTESHPFVQHSLRDHGFTTNYTDVLQRQWSREGPAAAENQHGDAPAEPLDVVEDLQRQMSQQMEHQAPAVVREALRDKMQQLRESAQRIHAAVAAIPGCAPSLLHAAVQKERMVEAIRLALVSSPEVSSPLDDVANDVRGQLNQIAFDALCLVAKQIPEAVRVAKVNISACRALELEVTTMTKALHKLAHKGELPQDGSSRSFAETLTVYLSALAFIQGQNEDGLVSQALGGVETVQALHQVRERLKTNRLSLGLHPDLGAEWDTDSTVDRFAPAASQVHSPADTPAASPTASRRSGRLSLGDSSNGALNKRHPWQLDYDLLIFETNKRGHRKAPMGRGSFGDVYKATLQGRAVAVKVLRDEVKTCKEQFFMELELAHRLRHTNIVDVLGGTCPTFGTQKSATGVPMSADDAEYTIVMEYVQGPTLAELIANGPDALTDTLRLHISRQIASALSYLHCTRPKIVHRDLKPANILVGPDFTPKICDFGLAMTKQSTVISSTSKMDPTDASVAATRCNVRGFTEYYAAPELLSGRKRDDPRSDIFSFGLVLFELWTGQPCWGKDEQRPADAIVRGDRPSFAKAQRHVPPIIRRLIERCWMEKPSNRPQAVDVLSLLMLPSDDLVAPLESGRFARVGPLLPEWLKQRDGDSPRPGADVDWMAGMEVDPHRSLQHVCDVMNRGNESLNAEHWTVFHAALRSVMFSPGKNGLAIIEAACDVLNHPAFRPTSECTAADKEVIVPFLWWSIRLIASLHASPQGNNKAALVPATSALLAVLPPWASQPNWCSSHFDRVVASLVDLSTIVAAFPTDYIQVLATIAQFAASGQLEHCSGTPIRKLALTALSLPDLPPEQVELVTTAIAQLLASSPVAHLPKWITQSFRLALLSVLPADPGVGAVTCLRTFVRHLSPSNRVFIVTPELHKVALQQLRSLSPHDAKWEAVIALMRDTVECGLQEFVQTSTAVSVLSCLVAHLGPRASDESAPFLQGMQLVTRLLMALPNTDDEALRCFELSRQCWINSDLIGASVEMYGAALRCQSAPWTYAHGFAEMVRGLLSKRSPRAVIVSVSMATSNPRWATHVSDYDEFVECLLPTLVDALEQCLASLDELMPASEGIDAIGRITTKITDVVHGASIPAVGQWLLLTFRNPATRLATLVDAVEWLQRCCDAGATTIVDDDVCDQIVDALTDVCARRDVPVPHNVVSVLRRRSTLVPSM